MGLRVGRCAFLTPTQEQPVPGPLPLQPLASSGLSGWGPDEGQEGGGWPEQAPRGHALPQAASLTCSTLSSGGSFLELMGLYLLSEPSGSGRREAVQGGRGRALALTHPWSWRRRGGVRREGPSPFQGLGERGFVALQPPPPGTGTFLGRDPASSPALGHGAEARGWAGGLSMGLCACSQGASVAELTASTLGPIEPHPPGHPGAQPSTGQCYHHKHPVAM